MEIVPERLPPEFAATWYWTDPSPVPREPDETTIQLSLLVAVHWQAFAEDTEIEPEPPEAETVVCRGLIE
jgi:hypothetical protein